LVKAAGFELGFLEFKATVDDQIIADKNRGMTLSWGRCRSTALWTVPGHNLEVKNVDVIEVALAIPAAEDVHLGATNNVGRVIKSCRGSSSASWTLEPCHRDWIKGVEILETFSFVSFTAKNNNS
jgi:hypothetical protein